MKFHLPQRLSLAVKREAKLRGKTVQDVIETAIANDLDVADPDEPVYFPDSLLGDDLDTSFGVGGVEWQFSDTLDMPQRFSNQLVECLNEEINLPKVLEQIPRAQWSTENGDIQPIEGTLYKYKDVILWAMDLKALYDRFRDCVAPLSKMECIQILGFVDDATWLDHPETVRYKAFREAFNGIIAIKPSQETMLDWSAQQREFA